MRDNLILNKIKEALGIDPDTETREVIKDKTVEVKLEQLKLDNGTVVEAESFEANAEIFIVSEDERIPLPVGDYTLEDGRIIVVTQEGIIAEIKDKETAPEETTETTPAREEVEAKEVPKKVIKSISEEVHFSRKDLDIELQKLRDEFNEKFALKTKVELEKTEEKTDPLKHSPDAEIETNQLNRFSQNRTMTTEDIVFKRMFN